MTNKSPSTPLPDDFADSARAGEEAGIADESAAYDRASETKDDAPGKGTPTEESSAHPS